MKYRWSPTALVWVLPNQKILCFLNVLKRLNPNFKAVKPFCWMGGAFVTPGWECGFKKAIKLVTTCTVILSSEVSVFWLFMKYLEQLYQSANTIKAIRSNATAPFSFLKLRTSALDCEEPPLFFQFLLQKPGLLKFFQVEKIANSGHTGHVLLHIRVSIFCPTESHIIVPKSAQSSRHLLQGNDALGLMQKREIFRYLTTLICLILICIF